MTPQIEEALRLAGKHPLRIPQSAGGGSGYMQSYENYMKQHARSPEYYPKMSRAGFYENQARQMERLVEKPMRPHVKRLIEQGKFPVQSNEYGPGKRGVTYTDAPPPPRGEQKGTIRERLAAKPPQKFLATPPPPGMRTGKPNLPLPKPPRGLGGLRSLKVIPFTFPFMPTPDIREQNDFFGNPMDQGAGFHPDEIRSGKYDYEVVPGDSPDQGGTAPTRHVPKMIPNPLAGQPRNPNPLL